MLWFRSEIIFHKSLGNQSLRHGRNNWDFTSTNMSNGSKKLLVTIKHLEFITRIWGNVFIELVISVEWIKNKKISLFYLVFTCAYMSRIGVICIYLEDSRERVFYPEMPENHQIVNIIIDFFWSPNNSLGIWSTTYLGILYFFKLSHFSHLFFSG
jgi:hypothetical protein